MIGNSHEKFLEKMESDMNKNKKWAIGGFGAFFVGAVLLNLGLLAFGIWVIVKLMQHFGVI